MTRVLAFALLLALAGCATAPNQAVHCACDPCRCATINGTACEPSDQCGEMP